MVIHSVTPMQFLMAQNDTIVPEETTPVQGGFLQGRRTPQGFQIARVCSTDPSVYLKYSPGGYYSGE